jgi:hypothetical protein
VRGGEGRGRHKEWERGRESDIRSGREGEKDSCSMRTWQYQQAISVLPGAQAQDFCSREHKIFLDETASHIQPRHSRTSARTRTNVRDTDTCS